MPPRLNKRTTGLSSSDEMGDSQGLDAFLNAKDISEENQFVTKGDHKMEHYAHPNDIYSNMNMYDEYGYDFEEEEEDEVDEYNFEVDFSKPKVTEQKKPDPGFSEYELRKQKLEQKREAKRIEEEEQAKREKEARERYEAQLKREQDEFLASIEEKAKKQKERIAAN